MRVEWLVVTGCGCLVTALVEAWCLTAIRGLQIAAMSRVFPDSQQLLRSHIDYLMMSGLLFVSFLLFKQFGVTPPTAIVAASCAGSVMNPAAFLALAINPNLGRSSHGPFAAIATVSFVLTTVGYGGTAWLLAGAALGG